MTSSAKQLGTRSGAAMLAAGLAAATGWGQSAAREQTPPAAIEQAPPAATEEAPPATIEQVPPTPGSQLRSDIYPDAPAQLVAVVHAHTRASSGSDTVSSLSRRAADAGLDVIVLTENLGYEFRYAPQFLRPFFEARRSTPTIEDHGIERYVAEVNETERLNPNPLLLVGVEVPAYYYWTGSLFNGDLTLHDMQRNVLVMVPPETGEASSPPAYDEGRVRDFLEGLPAVGNQRHRRYGLGRLLLLLPGVGLVSLAARSLVRRGLFRARSYRPRYRLNSSAGRYVRQKPVHKRFATWFQVAVLSVGIVLLHLNFPYSVASLRPYDAAAGHQPFERLFQHARDEGGHAFWSMPEAVDYHDFKFGPIAIKLSTHPYPEVLTETSGYTGFGGVYADTISTTAPGGRWDQAIASYQRGDRASFPVLLGESAFHFSGQAGKELDDVVTVLLVDTISHTAAFDALVGGRSYSVRRDAAAPDLRLTEFAASRAGGPATGSLAARSGETLELDAAELEIALRVDDEDRIGVPVEVDVIRQGVLHRQFSGTTPVRLQWLETMEPDEPSVFFRVMVRGPQPSYVVSNPIFVRRVQP